MTEESLPRQYLEAFARIDQEGAKEAAEIAGLMNKMLEKPAEVPVTQTDKDAISHDKQLDKQGPPNEIWLTHLG